MKFLHFIYLFISAFLFCFKNDDIGTKYNLLRNNSWRLEYISLNGIKQVQYPFNLTNSINIMLLRFSTITCKEWCIDSYYQYYVDKNGNISLDDKKRMDDICQAECNRIEHVDDKGMLTWTVDTINFKYSYSGYCNCGSCTYRIVNNRLKLNDGGTTASNCIFKDINMQDLNKISNLSFSIAFRNNSFNVNNDSLVLNDSLGYSLILKPPQKDNKSNASTSGAHKE